MYVDIHMYIDIYMRMELSTAASRERSYKALWRMHEALSKVMQMDVITLASFLSQQYAPSHSGVMR